MYKVYFMVFKSVVFTFCFTVFFISVVQAQTLETVNGSSGDDEFTSILSLSDGSFILSGSTSSINGFGDKDIYVVRLSPSHNVIWSRNYGGANEDAAYTSIVNSKGNVIIVGSSSSFNGGGNLDIVLLEIDIMGNIQSNITFKTTSYDEIPRKIIESDNGFVLCATSNFVGTTASPDILVFEFSELDQLIIWQNLIGSTDLSGDIPSSIIESNSGGYILVGGTKTFDTNYDQIIVRLNDNGTINSHIAYGGVGNENAQDAIELENGDVIVMGNFRTLSGSGLEMALTRISSDNSIQWIKTYGDKGLDDDRPYAFRRSLNGEYVMAGYSYSYGNGNKDLILLEIDPEGNVLESYVYGNNNGDEQPWDMILKDSEIVVVGSSSSNGSGLKDAYIFKKRNQVDNECFSVDVVQNNLSLSTHVFNYIQNNPNLILDTIVIGQNNIVLDERDFIYNKIVNGKIDKDLMNLNGLDLFEFDVSLYDKNNYSTSSNSSSINKSGYFALPLTSDQQLFLNGFISTITTSPHLLMKYRNGFDAFQMENIITNKINAPLQIDPSPLTIIAADVDLSDKIRANDISLLQEVIVKKRDGFPQELPAEINKDYLEWRFIDQRTVDTEDRFKKSSQYPYYSSKGYFRDNVPDVPFYLSNQGSCDESYTETYNAILLGDLVTEGSGVNLDKFYSNNSSSVTLDIDDVHDIGNNTYRVFFNHTLDPQDRFVSFDFALDYNQNEISITDTRMMVDQKTPTPQWLSNDYKGEELLFTSYTGSSYPLTGNLVYIDIQKSSGVPRIEDLGQLHVFVNGSEVPSSIRLRSQTSTGIDLSKDVSEFVNIYPNPTEGQLSISMPLAYSQHVLVEFINTIGQTVLTFNNEQAIDNIELDISTLPKGLYQCLITIDGKAPVMKKVVLK